MDRTMAALDEEFGLRGTAPVVVILAGASGPGPSPVDPKELDRHFIPPENNVLGLAQAARAGRPANVTYLESLGIVIGSVSPDGLRGLRQDTQRVARVCAAPQYKMLFPGPARRLKSQGPAPAWGIEMLGFPSVPACDGAGVLVGHLDSGIDANHPALGTALDSFLFFTRSGVPDPNVKAHDFAGHGTHTAATIAGRIVPGHMRVGAAPAAKLISAVVGEDNYSKNPIARLIAGMTWAMDQGARVINMSVGIVGPPDAQAEFEPIVELLVSKNILLVCSIGNSGSGTSVAPGNYSRVLGAGACDDGRQVWPQSSSQQFPRRVPNLIAPGVGVYSAIPMSNAPGWGVCSGTSMAAAHVSGLAAVLMGAHGNATAAQIQEAILQSCVLDAAASPERASRGIPDLQRALNWLERTLPN